MGRFWFLEAGDRRQLTASTLSTKKKLKLKINVINDAFAFEQTKVAAVSIDFAHHVAGAITLTVQLIIGHETKTAEKSQRLWNMFFYMNGYTYIINNKTFTGILLYFGTYTLYSCLSVLLCCGTYSHQFFHAC